MQDKMTKKNVKEHGVGRGRDSTNHLRVWKKGESGNPKGRPKKGQSLTERLYTYGEKWKKGQHSKTYNDEFIEKFWKDMLTKGERYLKTYYMDRIDGKPKESITLNRGADEENMNIDDLPPALQLEYHKEALKKLNKKS